MKCEKIVELIYLYLDEETTSSEEKLIQLHIAHCQPCKRELTSLMKMKKMLKKKKPLRASPDFLPKLILQLGKLKEKDKIWMGFKPVYIPLIPTLLLLLVIATLLLFAGKESGILLDEYLINGKIASIERTILFGDEPPSKDELLEFAIRE